MVRTLRSPCFAVCWVLGVACALNESEDTLLAAPSILEPSRPSQRIAISWTQEGARIQDLGSNAGNDSPGIRISLLGTPTPFAPGRCPSIDALPGLEPCSQRVERAVDGRVEWWEEGAVLEHGFDLLDASSASLPLRVGILDAAVAIDGDGLGATLNPAEGGPSFRYAGLLARDADGAEIAARMEPDDAGLRIVLDPGSLAQARFPIRVDPFVTVLGWQVWGEQTDANFGSQVAPAGDVNNDGFDDVTVVAPGYDGPGGPDTGAAYLYLGAAAGLSATPSIALGGGFDGLLLTQSTTAGDVNGDGFGDLLLAAPGFDGIAADAGIVVLYLGSDQGLGSAAVWTLACNQAGAACGFDVGTAGDLNADGFSELVVGAPTWDNGENDEGGAFVWYGSVLGIDGGQPLSSEADADWIGEGNQEGADFGRSVSAAFDTNGDGFGDLIVGAPLHDVTISDNYGKASVYLGASSGLATSPVWTLFGDQASAAGSEVKGVGDCNGDGYADVTLGSPFYTNPSPGEGRVRVFPGSAGGPLSAPLFTREADQDSAYFGISIAPAGDIDGECLYG